MNRMISPSVSSFVATIRRSMATWFDHGLVHGSLYAPSERAHWASCTEATLRHRFPPRRTHRFAVYEQLGEPDEISHLQDVTLWHYQILEFWLPHASLDVFPPLTCQHDLTFSFDALGRLDDVARRSR